MYIQSWKGAKTYRQPVGDVTIAGMTIPPIALAGAAVAIYFAFKSSKK